MDLITDPVITQIIYNREKGGKEKEKTGTIFVFCQWYKTCKHPTEEKDYKINWKVKLYGKLYSFPIRIQSKLNLVILH